MSLQSRYKKPKPAQPVISFSGPRLLTVKEAARYIGHSTDLVRELVQRREIPVVKKGEGGKRRHYVIDRLDLDAYVERKKQYF